MMRVRERLARIGSRSKNMKPSDRIAQRAGNLRLVVRSPPQPDESLYGWAVRLANANCCRSVHAILSLVKKHSPTATSPQDKFARLIGGSSTDFERYVRSGRALYCGGELGGKYLNLSPNVCPACLAERAVLKAVWHLKIWRYCPQHSCKLFQVCPFCRYPLGMARRAVTHCGNVHCKENLSRSSIDPIPVDIINIVRMLGDIVTRRRSDRFPELPESVRDISLHDLVRLIAVLNRPLLCDANDWSQEASVHERLKIVEGALMNWPHGYYRYLHQVRSTRFDIVSGSACGSYIEQEFPFLFRSLTQNHSRLSDDVLKVLKEELASYVEENVPQALSIRSTLTGVPSRWITLDRASRELGVSSYVLSQAERENVVQTTASPLKINTRHFVERDQFLESSRDRLRTRANFKARNNLVSFAEAKTVLRVGKTAIRELISDGYIKSLSLRGATWCKASSIEDLLARLAKVAKGATGGCPTVELARTRTVSSTARLGDVLKLALDEKMPLSRAGSAKRGLRRYHVGIKDIARLFPVTPEGYLSLPEAARVSYFPKHVLRPAVRCGLLPSLSHPKNGRMIKRTAFAVFQRRYVSSAELRMVYNVGARRITIELADKLEPVSGMGKIRLWYRHCATAILDRRFSRAKPPKAVG
jgi:TniQ